MQNNPPPKPSFSLKDHLFHRDNIRELTDRIKSIYPSLDHEGFESAIMTALPSLELKARIDHIAHQFARYIEGDYETQLQILLKSLREPLDPDRDDDDFGNFIDAPYSAFVALYGRERQHLETSLTALEKMTQRFSAEFAIRHFFRDYPNEVLDQCMKWSESENYHVRRLASEGSRPSLPWGAKIPYTLGMTDNILHTLYHDPTTYVRRSVANHLHDIGKIDPDHLFGLLGTWRARDNNPLHFEKLGRHALRTLIKSGHPKALDWIGVGGQIDSIELSGIQPSYTYGETVLATLRVISGSQNNIRIDYRVGYSGKGGKLRYKTYTLHEGIISGTLEKMIKIPLIDRSTRVLIGGLHTIEVIVNGEVGARGSFELVK